MSPLAQRYVGKCLGGPYDGQSLEHYKPRYPILLMCSTAEKTAEQWTQYEDLVRSYQDTAYVFQDSTWVWKSE